MFWNRWWLNNYVKVSYFDWFIFIPVTQIPIHKWKRNLQSWNDTYSKDWLPIFKLRQFGLFRNRIARPKLKSCVHLHHSICAEFYLKLKSATIFLQRGYSTTASPVPSFKRTILFCKPQTHKKYYSFESDCKWPDNYLLLLSFVIAVFESFKTRF